MTCACITDIEEKLDEHTLDTAITISRDLKAMEAKTYTPLIRRDNGKAERRTTKPRVFGHTFCPFCGTRYEAEASK